MQGVWPGQFLNYTWKSQTYTVTQKAFQEIFAFALMR